MIVKETSGAFITTWRTTADNESITIPVGGATGRYDVIWGDGTISENVRGDQTHPYATSGDHTVTILGGFERIYLNNAGVAKLVSIDQWGDTQWTSMQNAFQGAGNMAYKAIDVPDLSGVRDMSHMFSRSSFNGDVSLWNVSQVIDMSHMFDRSSFNGNVSSWDVSHVTSMDSMFVNSDFNQPLNNWNVSQVINMRDMFANNYYFNHPLNNWDVSSVSNMGGMFRQASDFNQPLNNWNVSSVTSMQRMFNGASDFDHPLNNWNVSSVANMYRMFSSASSFDQPLNNWNVSSVTDMRQMFFQASDFNGDISGWDVSKVNDMSGMFTSASSFDQNLGEWYVVANATSIARADVPGVVAEISAQNSKLDEHNPTYGIVSTTDPAFFEIVGGNQLNMTSAGAKSSYTVNVTTSGPSVFESGNNWHVLEITVTGSANTPPSVSAGGDLTVAEGDTLALSGSATDTDGDNTITSYTWSATPAGITFADASSASTTFTAPDVTADTTFTLKLTASDGTDDGDDTIDVIVKETSGAFITTWRTTADNESITIPVGGATGAYDVIWGDGTNSTGVAGDQRHSYATSGNHTVAISGGFERIHLNGHADASKLRSIDQWGDTQWTSMKSAFNGTGNMITMMAHKATDAPDLSGVQDMSGMFEDSSFNGNISGWNVSQVTDMSGMFYGAASFDQSLNGWNVSQVTDMSNMFYFAASFDRPLNGWNVSQVTDMGGMFYGALTFNGNVSSWNVSQVTDMSYMFSAASAFDGDISGWNVSQVTSMLRMFFGASDFDGDISGWNVSQVTDMLEMFSGASSFDRPLNGWNVSSVTIMNSMFSGASNFNQPLNDWNVSSVIHTDNMFYNATSFNQPLNDWNVSSVTTMGSMFRHASNFNGDISGWNVSQVTHMDNMFYGADAFNQDLDSWNTSRVSDMSGMFIGASDFNGDISDWNVSSVTNMNGMFADASNFNGDISGWNVSSVSGMSQMFDGADSFEQNLGEWYIVPADTAYDVTTNTLNVTTISAQNLNLKGHDPNYAIGAGGNFTLFNMTGSTLMFKAAPSAGGYTANVTAFGLSVFESGNNWHVLEITVTGSTNTPPTVMAGGNLTVAEGDTLALSGSATDTDGDNTITSYTWSAQPGSGITFANASLPTTTFTAPSVDADATYTLTLTASDGTDDGDDTIDVTVKETSGAFITTWRTTADNESITIPVGGATGTYDVIWGDGTAFTGVTGDQRHFYAVPGDHTVTISGGFERIYINSVYNNAPKLVSIDQWGNTQWISMHNAFQGATGMAYSATDVPDLSGVQNMRGMFDSALSFNGDLSSWNVSSVTNMSEMFLDATIFNLPINNWDVSSVTTMERMFLRADNFDQHLNNWDVSSVTNMFLMFSNADNFNRPLNSWNVSSVIIMDSMFLNTDNFDQPLNSWNVSSVTIMDRMFFNAADFNQPLNSWNVSSVTDMGQMFSYAADFNQPLNSWNVSSVTDMGQMFDNANSFHQNLGEWYVVANATSIARADVPGVVAEISAQNVRLDQHTPMYGIVAGDLNATHFEIISGNQLNMTSDVSGQTEYSVNVTASGTNVFENGNNWHVLEITVTDSTNNPPTVNAGTDQTVGEGDTVTLSGTATDSEGDAITSYTWSAMPAGITFTNASSASTTFTAPDVTSDTTYTFRLTVSDGTDDGTDIIDVTVKDTSGAFITTWRTISAGQSITIPVGGATGTYDVIWGDGTAFTGLTGDQTHSYAVPGNHTVAISGGFERIHLNNHADASKLRSIDQWGDIGWTSMRSAFNGASVMTYGATDAPDLSRVTDVRSMFRGATAFNGNLSNWNVSSVTDRATYSTAPPPSTSPSPLGTSPLSPTLLRCSATPPLMATCPVGMSRLSPTWQACSMTLPSTSPSPLGTSPLSPT